jgi:hypothetical protein
MQQQQKKMLDLFEDMKLLCCLYGFIAKSNKKQKNAETTIQPINSS